MTEILVLTGAPGSRSVTAPLISDARALLTHAGAEVGEARSLAAGEASEFSIDGIPLTTARDVLSDLAAKVPVDFSYVCPEDRRKKLLVADMDSTMITAECIDELADFAGLRDQIVGITERAMRGELEFESALRERVAFFDGVDASILKKVFDERIVLTPGAKELIATMNASGAFTALISGGFSYFTGRVAALLGFGFEQANVLLKKDGKLTGKVNEPILGRDAKRIALETFAEGRGLEREQTMSVGDGANDLAMIEAAGLGVAFHAKPLLAEAADVHIEHGDLTALLYLQGYTKAEFVTP
jgi:phosphoserine phosphatase